MRQKYTVTKRFELGSTAFRQWRAESHCRFIHGYRLTAEITFGCERLDKRNWVIDYGGFAELKKSFRKHFDHKLWVATDDPCSYYFLQLQKQEVADIVWADKIGTEAFTEQVLSITTAWLTKQNLKNNRNVWVESVTVREHENNSATITT